MAKSISFGAEEELEPGDAAKGKNADDSEYMEQMRERYSAAKSGWQPIYDDFRGDVRFISGNPADQWGSLVKSARDDDGIPALTMDRTNPLINQIVNQARKDRPQPKVNAGDGGDPATGDVIEGKMRHCLYESHADVAFDYSQMYCAAGGIGFYRITKEYTSKRGWIQEPRVVRVPDPTQILFEPEPQEIDFSDAGYCFVPKKYTRAEFRQTFKGVEPVPFPFDVDNDENWSSENKVTVAEYWWVEKIPHRLVQLADGRTDIASEIPDLDESQIVNERQIFEKVVHCDIVDGARKLEESIWEGQWIPIIPQIAKEVYSEGKRRFVSAIRYMRDPQTAINAAMSKTATAMATINEAPFTGPKGAFKDRKWSDGKRHFYLEYEPLDTLGNVIQPGAVQRNAFEPAIQGSTSFTAQSIDALKGALGYVDSVTLPSQQDLSGIAVEKRDAQANEANLQYSDSLTQSMWHCGRVMVDLLLALADTPRVWQSRKEDGTQRAVPVTMDVPPGTNPEAPGYEGQPHTKIDDGDYGVTISVGPSFSTKTEEGTDFLLALIKADPALIPIYAPAIFKRLGYEDLEQIAEAAQPPQIRQALMQAQGKGPDPAMVQQQAQAISAKNQQLTQLVQHLAQVIQTKQVETDGKLQVQNAKTSGDLAVQKLQTIRALIEKATDHQHDATTQLTGHHVDAVKHILDMTHAAGTAQQAQEFAASQPQPQGNQQ